MAASQLSLGSARWSAGRSSSPELLGSPNVAVLPMHCSSQLVGSPARRAGRSQKEAKNFVEQLGCDTSNTAEYVVFPSGGMQQSEI